MSAVSEEPGRARGWTAGLLRWFSLRLRLVLVFGLVALTAAVSASAIAYWLNRDAVLTRTQNAALDEFRKSLKDDTDPLPSVPTCPELRDAATRMADNTQKYEVLLITRAGGGGSCSAASDKNLFTLDVVPASLRRAVDQKRSVDKGNASPYHLYWQRITLHGTPYLVGGARVNGGGPTGYLLKSLDTERQDLNSLAWSLGIATALALIGAALLAQAAAATVLRPVRRLGEAAHRLGEGHLDTRLQVSGSDELANLSHTFNRAAERLQKRVAELSAREASSRRFVADMSHELRTPLTAITAVTEVLEEEADSLDPMIAPAVQLVVSETRRLNDLVENLMEVTRFDAGTARLVLDDVDVADQVTACIDARAWLDAVELDAARGIVARLDPRRLDVILANLIGNALKHGGSPVRVSVRTEGDELLVKVRDHGPGIPEDVLPHVFDRFYKASASRPRSEGSGLGLSIAMENAHIHGGDISAANSPDGGAVFTLRLPMDASPIASDQAADERDREGAAEGDGAGTVPRQGKGKGRGRGPAGKAARAKHPDPDADTDTGTDTDTDTDAVENTGRSTAGGRNEEGRP
ncbi:HAMP domain-containing sensor histidine kinase [Streptomyces sp. RKCA744]|uniref:sensor histidine kinase n=1 Tax=Streptomyces sp. RKCA744 TaxID=2959340 RepID=UPI00209EBBFF|nr:HAMP domain-containing sensor histidine kinase [Streptomyces sp. RKCA744]MCO8305492.1 HAMP domain-containing histidine kinase [Streptomyces sp. RKCA744]